MNLCILSLLVCLCVQQSCCSYYYHNNDYDNTDYNYEYDDDYDYPDRPKNKTAFAPILKEQNVKFADKTLRPKYNDIVRLNCGSKGNPKPKFRFYKDGKRMKKGDRKGKRERVDVRKTMIMINKASPKDNANYSCFVYNEIGNFTVNWELKVKPRITLNNTDEPHWTKPERMEKTLHAEPAGNTVQFKCHAGGANLTVRWYKDGKEISTDPKRRAARLGSYKFRHDKQVMTLQQVILGDVGKYTCEISNHLKTISHTYELDVTERSNYRPILHFTTPENKTLYVGDNYTIECKVFSDAHPFIFWKKYDSMNETRGSDNYKTVKEFDLMLPTRDMMSLKIVNATLNDTGLYAVTAVNANGQRDHMFTITVLERPPPDQNTGIDGGLQINYIWLILIGVPVCIGLLILNAVFCHLRHRNATPRLTPIKNPDCIPALDHIESPGLMFGDELWQKLLFSGTPNLHLPICNVPFDEKWEISKKNIFLHERIDEGFFGQVYRAAICLNRDGKNEKVTGAVKMLKNNNSEKDVNDLVTEMEQLKRIGPHINIISLIGMSTQEGALYLITEYASQGNLRDFLRRNRPSNIDLPEIPTTNQSEAGFEPRNVTYQDLISASYQVARGMEFLAINKCVHRDLAARNVLVTNNFEMKIADFGLARDVRSHEYYRKVSRGHLPYKWMAIESMVENVFTHATDVWSFGVLLWEVFTLGGSPYPGIKTVNLVELLRSGMRLEHPQFASPLLYRLMKDCWEVIPQDRPKFRDLLEDLERMLNATTSDDYIDLNVPCDVSYSVATSSDEQDEDTDDDYSDVINDQLMHDSDSVFERDSRDFNARQQQENGNMSASLDETANLLQQDGM